MMSAKKLPETDDERIGILRAAVEREEENERWDKVLSLANLEELRLFIPIFEGAHFILNRAMEERDKTKNQYNEYFKNTQLYISHFIQVLFLAVIRHEIKAESLALYGLQENDPSLPDLSTEEAVLTWAENVIHGESERTVRGGISLYNPTIAKVKVYYELLKESIHTLSVYDKNIIRSQNKINDLRIKADTLIQKIWTKAEEQYERADR